MSSFDSIKSIKVYGPGCESCEAMSVAVKDVLNDLGIDIAVEHITELQTIMKLRIMSLPALAINDEIVAKGKALTKTEVEEIIKRYN